LEQKQASEKFDSGRGITGDIIRSNDSFLIKVDGKKMKKL